MDKRFQYSLETTNYFNDTGKKHCETGLGNDIIDKTLKPQTTKEKNNK